MAKIGRPGLPSDRRQQVWEMWRAGSSLSEISRTVGSPPGSIFSILLPYGGFYQPPQRRRPGCLCLAEREEISRMVRRVVDKLLHRPTVRVREFAANQGQVDYAAALRELFALDPQAVAAVMSADTATDLPSVDAAVEVPIDAAVDAVAEPGADGVVDHDQRGRGERVHDQQGSR